MDIVDSLYNDTVALDAFLMTQNELSFRVTVDNNFRKAILLASASHFENEISNLILNFAKTVTSDEKIINFIKNKAISRQYHSFFSWESKNCNSFLGVFGEEFKTTFSNKVKLDKDLDQSIKDFLEIGNERNRLVHQDFGNFTIEKTANEIYSLHMSAKLFIAEIKKVLIPEIIVNKFDKNSMS